MSVESHSSSSGIEHEAKYMDRGDEPYKPDDPMLKATFAFFGSERQSHVRVLHIFRGVPDINADHTYIKLDERVRGSASFYDRTSAFIAKPINGDKMEKRNNTHRWWRNSHIGNVLMAMVSDYQLAEDARFALDAYCLSVSRHQGMIARENLLQRAVETFKTFAERETQADKGNVFAAITYVSTMLCKLHEMGKLTEDDIDPFKGSEETHLLAVELMLVWFDVYYDDDVTDNTMAYNVLAMARKMLSELPSDGLKQHPDALRCRERIDRWTGHVLLDRSVQDDCSWLARKALDHFCVINDASVRREMERAEFLWIRRNPDVHLELCRQAEQCHYPLNAGDIYSWLIVLPFQKGVPATIHLSRSESSARAWFLHKAIQAYNSCESDDIRCIRIARALYVYALSEVSIDKEGYDAFNESHVSRNEHKLQANIWLNRADIDKIRKDNPNTERFKEYLADCDMVRNDSAMEGTDDESGDEDSM